MVTSPLYVGPRTPIPSGWAADQTTSERVPVLGAPAKRILPSTPRSLPDGDRTPVPASPCLGGVGSFGKTKEH